MGDLLLDERAEKLRAEYGVLVPTMPDIGYSSVVGDNLNSRPSLQSLIELEEAMRKVPYAGSVARIILFHRTMDWTYIGRFWSQYLGSRQKGVEYDERPLMVAREESHFMQNDINELAEVINYDFLVTLAPHPSVKTARGRFMVSFFHEIGHGIDSEVFFRSCRDVEQYVVQAEVLDAVRNHPIYETFAELTGWGFGRGVVAQKMQEFEIDIGDRWLNPVLEGREEVDSRRWLFTRHSMEQSITEVFADFFAAYMTAPDVLTDQERRYFGRIHSGLSSSPEEFMQEVARNPKVLLK